MKVLKISLIVLSSLIALFLITPIFLSSSYKVERSIEINKPDTLVYMHVADFNKWRKWSPWEIQDPKAAHTIEGTPATVGHKWSWVGEKVGKGSLTINEIVVNKNVKMVLAFTEPQNSTSENIMSLQGDQTKTTITWSNNGQLGYPVGRWMGLMLPDMLGKDFDAGLSKLKELCEKQ